MKKGKAFRLLCGRGMNRFKIRRDCGADGGGEKGALLGAERRYDDAGEGASISLSGLFRYCSELFVPPEVDVSKDRLGDFYYECRDSQEIPCYVFEDNLFDWRLVW